MTRKRKILIGVFIVGCIAFIVLILPLFIRSRTTANREATLMLLAKPSSQGGTNTASQNITNDSSHTQ
jgi:hypothetical protein